jgi:hypothetical protein
MCGDVARTGGRVRARGCVYGHTLRTPDTRGFSSLSLSNTWYALRPGSWRTTRETAGLRREQQGASSERIWSRSTLPLGSAHARCRTHATASPATQHPHLRPALRRQPRRSLPPRVGQPLYIRSDLIIRPNNTLYELPYRQPRRSLPPRQRPRLPLPPRRSLPPRQRPRPPPRPLPALPLHQRPPHPSLPPRLLLLQPLLQPSKRFLLSHEPTLRLARPSLACAPVPAPPGPQHAPHPHPHPHPRPCLPPAPSLRLVRPCEPGTRPEATAPLRPPLLTRTQFASMLCRARQRASPPCQPPHRRCRLPSRR